jgi:hypothetical protein
MTACLLRESRDYQIAGRVVASVEDMTLDEYNRIAGVATFWLLEVFREDENAMPEDSPWWYDAAEELLRNIGIDRPQ